jgi:ABC-type branched-subunit amino acid transport system substrate-binding protein
VPAGCPPEEHLAELVEGHLRGEALADAEHHLAACNDCRRLVASMVKELSSSESTPSGTSHGGGDAPAGEPLGRNEKVGRYVVRGLVGSGAMGRVYEAHDPALDRRVALKLLRPDAATADLESRLLREAKAMARTTHPNVVTVYDAGKHGDQVYIAMEFVEGGTLRAWLAAEPRPWREVLSVFVRAGRGLAQAHAAGVVHRDFKPDNVLVGSGGAVVRVTDFGLARAAASEAPPAGFADTQPAEADAGSLDSPLTRTGALVGTPVYMAPEQHAGKVADARSDVYSFCVALYEGLYGERPFAAATLATLRAAKAAREIRPLRAGTRVPARLRRVLVTGLSPDPADRFPSMDALLDALERAARIPRAPLLAAALVLAAAAAAALPIARAARGARPSGGASPVPTGCASNSACVQSHGGEPWLCRPSDGACVAIASDECRPLFDPGDLEAGDTVWLGALFPEKGRIAESVGLPNLEAADFARKEFARATRPLTGSGASLRVRRVALVACDDGDPDGAVRAAHHLVEDVRVPAILGFRSGQEVMDLAASLLVARAVVSVATLATSPLITRIPQPAGVPRMVWRTTFSLEDVATATAGFVHDYFEPRRPAIGPTRVTLVRADAAGHVAFGQALLERLVFNGKRAVDNGPLYEELEVPADARDAGGASDRILATSPSFVIILFDPRLAVPMVTAVENHWTTPGPRPVYLVASDTLEPYAPFLGRSPDRRGRTFSVVSASSSATNVSFVLRFNQAHELHVSRTLNPGSSYDAFYWLAYASALAPDGPVTGPELARAFERLVPPGRPIEVGPTDVYDALAQLSQGGHIDLEGTSTSLDFDLATGEAPSDFALVCSDVDATGAAVGEGVESGVYFRAKEQRVDGARRCP